MMLAACATAPPCPYVPPGTTTERCPVCVQSESIIANGEGARVPSFSRAPEPDATDWSGESLPEQMPAPRLYVRCRPCNCAANGTLEPYDAWRAVNEQAYTRLRTAHAPYPVAIVPGFHGSPLVTRYRVRKALQLLQRGWVAAIIFSGGYRRGGVHEGAEMFEVAAGLAAQMGIDVSNRMFIEPCACRTSTNVRDSLRMMAAMRLPRGVLVTEARMTGQAMVLSSDFDALAEEDLQCHVGRISHLRGPTIPAGPADPNGCRPTISLTNNYFTVLIPRREAVLFWVSPFGRLPDGTIHSALECGVGSARIAECEPDAPEADGACLPLLGHADLRCEPPPAANSHEPAATTHAAPATQPSTNTPPRP